MLVYSLCRNFSLYEARFITGTISGYNSEIHLRASTRNSNRNHSLQEQFIIAHPAG